MTHNQTESCSYNVITSQKISVLHQKKPHDCRIEIVSIMTSIYYKAFMIPIISKWKEFPVA
jgi:hypothetical protein